MNVTFSPECPKVRYFVRPRNSSVGLLFYRADEIDQFRREAIDPFLLALEDLQDEEDAEVEVPKQASSPPVLELARAWESRQVRRRSIKRHSRRCSLDTSSRAAEGRIKPLVHQRKKQVVRNSSLVKAPRRFPSLTKNKIYIKYLPEEDHLAAEVYADDRRNLLNPASNPRVDHLAQETQETIKPGISGYDFDTLLKDS
jgi:hypothetical protein